ncbi:phosphate signaling complex protein PhoU [Opitutaceae bacterium TAV4]|uniref:phosphate signaling complex protein PhoU n=1 Tax=Geminisphaera colitermitum TaxID=1148786 RepID=UPI000158CDF8|nr:phosphate signaling complex protein PhoU [Geminisphaera colitermitum]RRJ98136.1 phosphate signaling complex protein PhoU [Opitutaceae bacterium TAV4]RRK02713.1 phosphate signaling complex protein PhoU [Opitutaceae bacterium TAV3]
MKRFFDTELESFRSHLLLMGELAIRQVNQAIKALVDADIELARKVISADDELDHLEIEIDNEAIRYMNLRAPIASELRLVIVGMKASHDLERVGDEASNIAKRVKKLALEAPLKPYVDIPRMAALATTMLRDSLDCFLNTGDPERPIEIIKRDEEVDRLNKQVYRELSSFMIERPDTITRALELMFISKSIERIADHATNIAEEMVFLTQARDIRHDVELKKK